MLILGNLVELSLCPKLSTVLLPPHCKKLQEASVDSVSMPPPEGGTPSSEGTILEYGPPEQSSNSIKGGKPSSEGTIMEYGAP